MIKKIFAIFKNSKSTGVNHTDEEQYPKRELRVISEGHWVSVFVDRDGTEHWPINGSLWGYYKYKELRDVNIPNDAALEMSRIGCGFLSHVTWSLSDGERT